jgi:hypothetical protein
MGFLGLEYEQLIRDYGPEVGLAVVVLTIVGVAIGLFIIYLKNYKLFHIYVNAYVDKRMQTLEGETMWEFRRYFRPEKVPQLPGFSSLQFRRSGLPIKEKGEFFFLLTWIGEDKIDLAPNTCKRRRSKQRQFHEVISPCYVLEMETPVTITVRLRPGWTLCNYTALGAVVALGAVGGPIVGIYYGALFALFPAVGCAAVLIWWLIDSRIHPYTKEGYAQYLFVNPNLPNQLVTGFEVKFWDLEQKGGIGEPVRTGELRSKTVTLTKLLHMRKKLHEKSIEMLSVSLELEDGLPKQIEEDYGTSELASKSPVGMRSLVREVMEARTKNSILELRMEEFEKRAAEQQIKGAEKRGNFIKYLTNALRRITVNMEEVYTRDVGVQSHGDYEKTFRLGAHQPEDEDKKGLAEGIESLREVMIEVSEMFAREQAGEGPAKEKKGRWSWRGRKK